MSALPSVGRADAVLASDSTRVLYEAYSRRIFAYCFSRLGSREEAEDATQTTFLNAFRSLQSGVTPQFELAWLYRIAENVCRDGHKSASRRRRLETTRDLQDVQDIVSAPTRNDDGLVGLGNALAGMPERQRRAILLREWRGLSYQEIATELGLSKAAVETLIFRARRTLARGLDAPVQRRAGFNVLSLLGAAKSALQGGAAAKVAASAIAVGGATLVVAIPLRDGPLRPPENALRAGGGATESAPTRLPPARATPDAATPATRPARPARRPTAQRRGASSPGAAPTRMTPSGLPGPASSEVPPPAPPPAASPGPAQATPGPAPASPQAPVASTPPAPPPTSIVPEVPGAPPLPPLVSPLPPVEAAPLPVPLVPPVELPGLPSVPPLP